MKRNWSVSFIQVDENTGCICCNTEKNRPLPEGNSRQIKAKDGPFRAVFMHIMNMVQKGLSSEVRSIQSHSAFVSLISRVERVDMSSSWFLAPIMGRTSKPPHMV